MSINLNKINLYVLGILIASIGYIIEFYFVVYTLLYASYSAFGISILASGIIVFIGFLCTQKSKGIHNY